jgi:hypothetical protein
VTWEHLFDENARVSRAKEMDESITGDGLRTELGGAFDGIQLGGFDPIEDGFCLG